MEGVRSALSTSTISLIEEAGARSELAISVLSVWEVAMLESRGRITLSRSIDEWIDAALTAPGTRLVELTPAIALDSTRLPAELHGDPADRIIVATTRVLGGTLITFDDRILEYSSRGHVRTRNCRSRS
jgi:PIN domain nuclease of toxin-antitoxin system